MIKNSQKQSGNALVVAVIVLVLALLGALGFIFWNNILNKDSDSVVNTDTSSNDSQGVSKSKGISTEVSDLVSKSLMTSDNIGINYKAPSTWSGGSFGGGDNLGDSESTTLTSSDGFVITMTISRLIRGWEYDSLTATILDVQKSTGTDLKWVIVDHSGGTTGPINLQIVNNQVLPSVGDKKLAGSSIYKLGKAEGSSVYLEMYGGYQKDMSLADFNAKQSVVEAKSIFESVKIGL